MRIQNIGKFIAVAIVGLFPFSASAQVVISEFMYDASGSDTNQEWVELYNAGGSPVDLTKWKINDGSNHVLNVPPKNGGTGSIILNAGSYIILADDAPAFISAHQGISVSIIDTALSLPNTSGTISLINESAVTEDSISYTKDSGAAGDGNTIQRVSVSGTSVIAGAPSPGTGSLTQTSSGGSGATNSNQTDPSSNSSTTTTTTTTSSNNLGQVSSVSNFPVEPEVFAYAGKDREAIAGADSIFEARAFNKDKVAIKPGRFLWTFGDGASAEGQTVMHHFSQPGRYAVVLDIADGLFSASHQIIVTVLPVSITLSLRGGDIVLSNGSSKNIDLSYWSLRSGGKFFIFPKNTILLGGASVPFTKEVTNLPATSDASLLYPNGATAAVVGADPAVSPTTVPIIAPKNERTTSPEAEIPNDYSDTSEIAVPDATTTAQVASVADATTSPYVWGLGVLGLAVLGGGAMIAARRAGKKEWDIVEG